MKTNNNSSICEEIKEKIKCAYNMKQSQINNYINYNNYGTNNNINNMKVNWYCPFFYMGNFGMMQTCNGYMNNMTNNKNCQMKCCNEIKA